MEEFLEGLRTFECPPPDPSELFSLEWREALSQSMMGNTWNKGRPIPQKQREKIRKTMLGVKHTAERRKNQSIAQTGMKHSAERCAKKAALQTGKHWYNNGKINKFDYECPDGFVPGMIKRRQRD
jgi:hypothetical protein